jgi:tetratricopeptide (TPR) repeat protein
VLLLLSSSLFSLELSVQTGEENQDEFSILHLKDNERFLCQAERDDLDVVTSVICAFNKRPIQPFSNVDNSFFSISSKVQKEMFFIIIKPHKKVELKAIHYDLLHDNELYQVEDDYASHWNIIAYKNTPPFLTQEKKSNSSINFPVPFKQAEFPYVGGLDILGNPIHMTRVKDVSDYLAIKKNFQLKRYDLVLEMIDDVLKEYPDTIFKNELMLYQIRAYHEKAEAESLIQVSKQFIREYSSDVNMAEVLADTANAYSDIALYTDADYFFDRLFDEHKESRYNDLGLIYKAKQLQNAGNTKKALEYYDRALKQTKELEIAARAAYEMVLIEMERAHAKNSVKYLKMILDAQADYFASRKVESIDLAMKYAALNDYQSAADIAGALLKTMSKSDDEYETLLKNRALWLSETEHKEEALDLFNSYIEQFKYGEYLEEVKEKKDALFFDVSDENTTQKLEYFDILMNKYAGDTIAKRALYEKAKLLYELKSYNDVLNLEHDLRGLDPTLYEETESLIDKSALGLMEASLAAKQCVKVVDLSKNYDINLSMKWDEDLYSCYIDAGDFDKAKNMAQVHIKSKNYDERMAWLERYIYIDFELGNYTEVIDAAKELIALRGDDKKNIKTYRLLFDASQRLGESNTMINAIQQIEASEGLIYSDIERYTQMVTLAQNIKDDVMLRTYAQKVIQLQDQANSYTQSPYIEFTLTQALLQGGNDLDALKVLASLDDRNLSGQKRSRQKYLMGTLFQKTGDNKKGKTAYEASIAADQNSSWANLAKDALKLLP